MANFDLSNVSSNSPLVKQFMQSLTKATGQMVTAFIAQKMKKISGESTKDLDFNLENGQTVTLVVRNDGDVVRVKLNGKDTPLKNDLFHFSADSFQAIGAQAGNKYSLSANAADRNSPAAVFAKAVEEIAAKVRQNQASFDKRRAQEKVVIPSRASSGSGGGSSSASVAARTKEIKTNLDDLDAQILQKTALRDELKQKLEARKAQIEQAQKAQGGA